MQIKECRAQSANLCYILSCHVFEDKQTESDPHEGGDGDPKDACKDSCNHQRGPSLGGGHAADRGGAAHVGVGRYEQQLGGEAEQVPDAKGAQPCVMWCVMY